MRKLLWVFLLLFMAVSSVHAYSIQGKQAALRYETVTVTQGDTLWTIAARYTTEREDIRQRIVLICSINGLDSNGKIMAGQQLKVPFP
ncbi:MAG: LysM domain-containing protein [Sporomusaceae bacterium]|nr:LysM domain-containing protein [Sporomusaceae bacterium]